MAQPMAVETVRMPQNAANRTIDRDRILARRGLRLPASAARESGLRDGDTRTNKQYWDHFRTGSVTDESSATPACPSRIRTRIPGQVNVLGPGETPATSPRPELALYSILGQRRRFPGCPPAHRDRWIRPGDRPAFGEIPRRR